jgi:hypothetical protein
MLKEALPAPKGSQRGRFPDADKFSQLSGNLEIKCATPSTMLVIVLLLKMPCQK